MLPTMLECCAQASVREWGASVEIEFFEGSS